MDKTVAAKMLSDVAVEDVKLHGDGDVKSSQHHGDCEAGGKGDDAVLAKPIPSSAIERSTQLRQLSHVGRLCEELGGPLGASLRSIVKKVMAGETKRLHAAGREEQPSISRQWGAHHSSTAGPHSPHHHRGPQQRYAVPCCARVRVNQGHTPTAAISDFIL